MRVCIAIALFLLASEAHAGPWLDASSGVQSLALRSLAAPLGGAGAEVVPTEVSGPVLGLGVGLSLGPISLGARGARTDFGDQSLRSLAIEVGVGLPLGPVRPSVFIGAGHSVFDPGAGQESVDGLSLRTGGAVDIGLTRRFSLGLRGTVEVMALGRDGTPFGELLSADSVKTSADANERLLDADGASLGWAWGVSGVLGVRL